MAAEDKCRQVINPGQRYKRKCGAPAVKEVTVNTVTGKGKLPVCAVHAAEYDRAAAALRVENK